MLSGFILICLATMILIYSFWIIMPKEGKIALGLLIAYGILKPGSKPMKISIAIVIVIASYLSFMVGREFEHHMIYGQDQ